MSYLNPFETRSFGERVTVVFKFAKSNFLQVMKYFLPIFLILGCIVSCLKQTVSPIWVLFISTAYFQQYINLQKDKVSYVSYSYMLEKSLGPSLGINLIGGLYSIVFLCLPFLVIIVPIIVLLAFMKLNSFIVISIFVVLFLLFFLSVIIYQINYFFSYKENRGFVTLFKDVFKLLKGNWLGSLAFLLFWGIVEFLLLIVVYLILDCLLTEGFLFDIILYTFTFILFSFFTNNAMIFQYGHLKSLQDNIKKEE